MNNVTIIKLVPEMRPVNLRISRVYQFVFGAKVEFPNINSNFALIGSVVKEGAIARGFQLEELVEQVKIPILIK